MNELIKMKDCSKHLIMEYCYPMQLLDCHTTYDLSVKNHTLEDLRVERIINRTIVMYLNPMS